MCKMSLTVLLVILIATVLTTIGEAASVSYMYGGGVMNGLLQPVFEVPLKYPTITPAEREWDTFPPSSLAGDTLYTVVAGQRAIESVNLKAQSFSWSTNASASIGAVLGVAGTTAGVLAIGTMGIEAFDSNGSSLFTRLNLRVAGKFHYAISNTTIAVVMWELATKLFIIDFSAGTITGTIQTFAVYQPIVNGPIFAIVRDETDGLRLKSMNLGSNSGDKNVTTNWEVRLGGLDAMFLVGSAQYIVMTRNVAAPGGTEDTQALVLDAVTGVRVRILDALNGVKADCVQASLTGATLSMVVGETFQRFVVYNLTNGYQIFTRTMGHNSVGCGVRSSSNVLVTNTHLVHMDSSKLQLSFTELPSGTSTTNTTNWTSSSSATVDGARDRATSATTTIGRVPSRPDSTVTPFFGNIVAVTNLQGYTLWDTATATNVGRVETEPAAGAPTAPIPYGQYYLFLDKDVVSVLRYLH